MRHRLIRLRPARRAARALPALAVSAAAAVLALRAGVPHPPGAVALFTFAVTALPGRL